MVRLRPQQIGVMFWTCLEGPNSQNGKIMVLGRRQTYAKHGSGPLGPSICGVACSTLKCQEHILLLLARCYGGRKKFFMGNIPNHTKKMVHGNIPKNDLELILN